MKVGFNPMYVFFFLMVSQEVKTYHFLVRIDLIWDLKVLVYCLFDVVVFSYKGVTFSDYNPLLE